MKVLLVAVCILEHEGRIPLIKFKRNYLTGFWGLPGGKLEPDEHLDAGASREIKEELGLDACVDEYLGAVDELAVHADGSVTRPVLFVSRMRATGPVSTEPRELPEGTIQWFTPEEIDRLEPEIVPSDFQIITQLHQAGHDGYYRSKLVWEGDRIKLEYFDRVGGATSAAGPAAAPVRR
ncbi:MAG: NUDIX domain-containing protein [bacterium]|nr:NUDIX domain-containing protein [bacterium]